MKQKIFKGIIIMMLLMALPIISIMLISVPSEGLNDWIAETYGIECDTFYNSCYKDNEKMHFTSSYRKRLMVFDSYEMNFKDENDQEETLRILGVFDTYFKMSDGKLWELLN